MQSMTEALGYRWDQSAVPRDVPRFSVERAVWRFHRSLPEYVWDAAVLEGNPFTYPEVQTLLDGITVGGRKISDEQQVLNLAEAANELLMSHGFDAISVPAARRQEFNSTMVEFFMTREGTGMFRFLASCRAEADRGVLPRDDS